MHVVTTCQRSDLAPAGFVALSALIGVNLAVSRWGLTGAMIAVALLFGAVAASVDLRTGRIPDVFVVAAAAPTSAVVISSIVAGLGADALAAAVAGGAAFGGPILIVHLVSPRALGFGDVKLAAVLGAALGLVAPGLGLVALCVAAAVTSAVGVLRRRRSLPFGPGLVLGATMALLIAGQLGEEASRWR